MVRLKNRYIVLEINTDIETQNKLEPLTIHPNALGQTIQSKVQQLHGDFGVAAIRSGFSAKYTNDLTRIVIVRCRHGPHKLVTSAIPFITNIDSHKVALNILYIGATIKQCFNYVKQYQERIFDKYCVELTDDTVKEALRKELLNLDSVQKALQS